MDTPDGFTAWHTIGHQRAVNSLDRGLREGRLSHAYLLVGPARVGKMTLAKELAQAVNCLGETRPCGDCGQCRRVASCLHPDVRVIGVESQTSGDGRNRVTIGIDQVREIQRQASLKPYEGSHRVFIFDGAELLSEEAANSLLKVLEEPPDQVVLVLLAADAESLLPTIVSRCIRLDLRPLSPSLVARELMARYEVGRERADEIARLSGGRLGWAIQATNEPELLEHHETALVEIEAATAAGLEERFSYAARLATSFGEQREPTRKELGLWLEWWRDVMLINQGASEMVTNLSRLESLRTTAESLSTAQIVSGIEAIRTAAEYLDRNVNPRLTLEDLMLALPRP